MTAEAKAPITTERIRMFYGHATSWVMPGAYKEKPKKEARLARVREVQAAEFDAWLAAHDQEVLERAAQYAERWGTENEEGGYARAAHSVAHAIRCGGVSS